MDFSNKWMSDATFLAQSAHLFGAYAAIITVERLWGKQKSLWAAGIFIILAAVKEFWYDSNYEFPIQTNFIDTLDFISYAIGVGIALLIIFYTKNKSNLQI